MESQIAQSLCLAFYVGVAMGVLTFLTFTTKTF